MRIPPLGSISLIFMQFAAKILVTNILVDAHLGYRLLLRNPGSVTVLPVI